MLSSFFVSLALSFHLFWGGFFQITQSNQTCVPFEPELEIPEDSRWISICITDPVAPDNGTVSNVSVKYTVADLDPNLLEIHLSKKGAKAVSVLWEPGNPRGNQFGKAERLQELVGEPSAGDWVFEIRNNLPGQKGKITEISLAIDYAPLPGPAPIPITEAAKAGRPVSIKLPVGAKLSSTPDTDSDKSTQTASEPISALTSTSGWQQILNETFEDPFPIGNWRRYDMNPSDNKEYYWDDSNYKYHNGNWAAWPANGGANCINPDPNTSNPSDGCSTRSTAYPNYMDSWMIYGPIDLSDAKEVETSFYLWHSIEAQFDYLFFGVATIDPGPLPREVDFTGLKYDGQMESWELKPFPFNLTPYLGNPNVYLAWYFHSDKSIGYGGPWVDDISVRKYVPGQVTAQGYFNFSDRDSNSLPAKDIELNFTMLILAEAMIYWEPR